MQKKKNLTKTNSNFFLADNAKNHWKGKQKGSEATNMNNALPPSLDITQQCTGIGIIIEPTASCEVCPGFFVFSQQTISLPSHFVCLSRI